MIDWPRLHLTDDQEVVSLLRLNEFDLTRSRDADRLMTIHNEAAGYLKTQLSFDLSKDLLDPKKIADLFRIASSAEDARLQKQACSLLKVMSIIQHVDGRELLYNCPISFRNLFSAVEDKIERALSTMNRERQILMRYQGGRKPKESLVTKLLCKLDTIAAQINDRVRYRLVTRTREDILLAILHLFRTVLPFNYVIPGVSVNQLIPLGSTDRFTRTLQALNRYLPRPQSRMEFSGKNYRICKFVADIPVRLDNFLAIAGDNDFRQSFGSIVYVMVEFQIVDQETDARNNRGQSSHDIYKKRQKRAVLRRLLSK